MNKIKMMATSFLIAMAEFNPDAFVDMWNELVETIGAVLIGMGIAATVIIAVTIGVKWWVAQGEEEKIKKAKTATKNLLIGWGVIVLFIVFIPVIVSIFAAWGNIDVIG